jgi:GNAT superfamily N-acetyltransferase
MQALSYIPVDLNNMGNYIALGKMSYEQHYLHLWEKQDPSSFFNTYLSEKAVKGLVEDPNSFPYIIYSNKNAVGILNVSLYDDIKHGSQNNLSLLLDKIYILKACTGQQVGSAALSFIEHMARTHQREHILLYAMKKGKPFHFYKRHGFRVVGETEITLPKVLATEKEMWVMEKTIKLPSFS